MHCLNYLIPIQFQDKQQVRHSNYVSETFNFIENVSTMLTGFKK